MTFWPSLGSFPSPLGHLGHPVHAPLHRLISTQTVKHACTSRTCPARARRARSQELQQRALQSSTDVPHAEDALDAFVEWLVANGVRGIGGEDSNVALYEEERGMRGVICLKDFAQGQELFTVPMRLALSEVWPKEDCGAACSAGLPHTRLAAKLLRQKALGSSSAWQRYLAVLPEEVASLYGSFPPQLYPSLEGFVPQPDLDKAQHRVPAEYSKLPQQAVAGATETHFRWAFSVVHSRALALPDSCPLGGRLYLVPFLDMLNHAGRQTAFLLGDASAAQDNVRWDVRQTPNSDWELAVTATQDIEAGEAALLCYACRPGSYFLLHYGFVPNRNPMEEVVLFQSLQEACDWALLSPTFKEICTGISEQDEQTVKEVERQLMAAADAAICSGAANAADLETPLHPDEAEKAGLIMLAAGGIVDARLWHLFASLGGGGEMGSENAARLVLKCCFELRQSLSFTLVDDLRRLSDSLPEEDNGFFLALHRHYEEGTRAMERDGYLEGVPKMPLNNEAQELQGLVSGPALQALKLKVFQAMIVWDLIIAMQEQSEQAKRLSA